MTISELLSHVREKGIELRKNGNTVILRGSKQNLSQALIEQLRIHKAALLQMIGDGAEQQSDQITITPEMLPLVKLRAEDIAEIVRAVPGGAANIQDIYPLAPLQEGILFHHLMSGDGDPYLLYTLVSFDTRARVDGYLDALQSVVDRHDILRTSVLWEGLPGPVQVVLRKASLRVEEVVIDAAGDVAEQLYARFDPRHYKINVNQAPLLQVCLAYDGQNDRWLMMQLLHHLAGDHSTQDVMQEEIEAHLLGRGDQLPPPYPFRNLVAQALLGTSEEEHEAFFQKMLGDVDEPTAPFGLLDVQGDGTGIGEARLDVDAALARRIRMDARRLGISAASLCHLAWAQVLARVSGREDVVFGTVLFGRMQGGEGFDRVMGLFINTLPVRINTGVQSVEQGARQVHALLADLLHHEHASLALAQRCSSVPAPAPLFSALLNYRHNPIPKQSPGREHQAWDGIKALRGEERTNYPVTLSVDDRGEGFRLTAQVEKSVDPMRVCQFMHTALESLVDALETAPSTPLSALTVLPEQERHQLLYDWNDTGVDYAANRCVHELFEEQVEKTPEATAVIFEGSELSYGELNRRANQLAHYLRELGVKPDDRVAICVDRGFEMVVSLLAVLKSGGAYVPLDPGYPLDRLRFMLEDSAPVVLLTQKHLEDLFEEVKGDLPVLDLGAASAPWHDLPEFNLDADLVGLSPSHLAYVIYTSGSTGNPKGVMVPHLALSNCINSMRESPGIGIKDTLLAITTISFDIAALEVFLPLTAGARIKLLTKEASVDVDVLQKELQSGITVMQATPTAWKMLTGSGWKGATDLKLLCGGEALAADVAEYLVGQSKSVWNMYGPTETTIWSVMMSLKPGQKVVPIGRPIANTQIYILDGRGEPVPVGVAGELYIGGAGVARGYLNRPELTAEKFLHDPYSSEADGRMYRTGDLGRWLADGNIEFLGRNDFQVKIRGFRIELGEIEARLGEYAGIRDVVVIAREDEPGDKRLVAYFMLESGESSEEDSVYRAELLRAHLSERLPEYMIPAAYVRLEVFPLTANGKLDRKSLPAPGGDAYVSRGYEAPQGEIETALAAIWADVLKLERVGRHDNFFELGGHSLLVVRMVMRLKGVGINVSVIDLFNKPTIELLAGNVVSDRDVNFEEKAICIRPGSGSPPLFLTHCGGLRGELTYPPVLIPHIDSEMPVYGLPSQHEERSPLQTVEGMAARMVHMIRAVQPTGPYRIAGWSFGGLLAYEIAVQLIGLDEEIEFLGLMDTAYPSGIPEFRGIRPESDEKLQFLMEVKYSDALDEQAHAFIDELSTNASTLPYTDIVQACIDRSILPRRLSRFSPTQIRQALSRQRLYSTAARNYHAYHIPGQIHLFATQRDDISDPSSGWATVEPKLQIRLIPVPGTHLSMMSEPHVASLGRAVDKAIYTARLDPIRQNEQPYVPITTLQAGDPKKPLLLCIPGAGSSVTSFTDLVASLGKEWPVYGILHRGLDGSSVPYSAVSTATTSLAKAAHRKLSDGIIHLLGHSFGGWLALEIAQLLKKMGHTVGSVTLLDTSAPNSKSQILEYSDTDLIKIWIETFELMLGRPLKILSSDLDGKSESEKLTLLHAQLVGEGVLPARIPPDVLRGPLRTFGTNLRTPYIPRAIYPEPVNLLLADDPRLDQASNQRRQMVTLQQWKSWIPRLTARRISGNHITLLKQPHVVSIAQLIGDQAKALMER